MMRSDFYERLERRVERAEDLAEKNSRESQSRFNAARQIQEHIPMGQPILVGHHSEKHHRADLKRIDNNIRKGIECQDKAAFHERRAESAQKILDGKGAIRSDDPSVIEKLELKLEALERVQKGLKEINSVIRKAAKRGHEAQVKALVEAGYGDVAEKLLTPDFAGRIGIPDYDIKNRSAEIRRLKERIEHESRELNQESKEYVINGVRVVESVEDNRIQLFFDSIPPPEVRSILKANGLRWCPTVGAWQRQLNNAARYHVERLLNGYQEVIN